MTGWPINTIRTLVIDAVQESAVRAPGAAMALAPVGLTLWNDVLLLRRQRPGWLNRDRFVLSAGHASMLVYLLLHLAQVRRSAGDSALAVPLADIQGVPAARQRLRRSSGTRADAWRRVHDRAAQHRRRRERRHGDGQANGGQVISTGTGFPVFDYSGLRRARRRLHDGGPGLRGRFTGRAIWGSCTLCWIYDSNALLPSRVLTEPRVLRGVAWPRSIRLRLARRVRRRRRMTWTALRAAYAALLPPSPACPSVAGSWASA